MRGQVKNLTELRALAETWLFLDKNSLGCYKPLVRFWTYETTLILTFWPVLLFLSFFSFFFFNGGMGFGRSLLCRHLVALLRNKTNENETSFKKQHGLWNIVSPCPFVIWTGQTVTALYIQQMCSVFCLEQQTRQKRVTKILRYLETGK